MNNEKEDRKNAELGEEEGIENVARLDASFESDEAEPPIVSKRRVAVFGIAGVILFGILGIAAYLLYRGEDGKPVAAPRNISFGNKSDSDEKLPAGERTVTLSENQLKAANLKIATVGETFDGAAVNSVTTGVVEANEYEETPVISQVSGVVKRISAELGHFVRRGQTIAVVSSEELAQTQSKYLSMKAELNEAHKRYKRALNLSEVSEESRNELDKTNANLKAREAKLTEAKSNYKRSQKLVKIGAISKREFEQVTAELKVAEANVRESSNRFTRARKLLKINPVRRNEIDQFLTKVRKMEADVASVREKLLVLGLPKGSIKSLNSPKQISADLPITSPISGTVTERIANKGEVVSVNAKLAKVTDLSTVWVIGQVYEKDLGKLRMGSGASIKSDAYPNELFRGNISYIDPNLDEKTRTAQVRVELSNPNQKLKMGMYVNISYSRIGGSEKTAPLVPKDAVQSIGNQKVVFEVTSDPKVFIIRPIKIGQEKDGSYPAIEGIFVGDKIVTDGSFLLRAEFLKTNSAGF